MHKLLSPKAASVPKLFFLKHAEDCSFLYFSVAEGRLTHSTIPLECVVNYSSFLIMLHIAEG